MKSRTFILSFTWLIIVVASFLLQYQDSDLTHRELIFSTSRALFERVVLTRGWNAMHGGVYVPVTEETQPNPYLDDPLRDIKVNDTLTLTKVNPAYMTRQLAELSARSGSVQIHITSLKPLRPENLATPREQKALESFEQGATEFGEIIKDSRELKFFYMAPLKVESACLHCHAKHGYKEGDIRGGISIIFPLPHKDHMKSLIVGHAAIGLIGLLAIFLFSIKLKQSYEIIEKQAVVDALTDIPNRRAFMERMTVEFKRRTRAKKPLSLIMADIDHFKRYNDTYGHTAGDDCLRKVAQTIKDNIKRSSDFCARYGGEEFVLLLPDTAQEDAVLIAERIRSAVESMKIRNEGAPYSIVTISLGVAAASANSTDSYERALQQADEALYSAKEKGRNRVEAYNYLPTEGQASMEKLS